MSLCQIKESKKWNEPLSSQPAAQILFAVVRTCGCSKCYSFGQMMPIMPSHTAELFLCHWRSSSIRSTHLLATHSHLKREATDVRERRFAKVFTPAKLTSRQSDTHDCHLLPFWLRRAHVLTSVAHQFISWLSRRTFWMHTQKTEYSAGWVTAHSRSQTLPCLHIWDCETMRCVYINIYIGACTGFVCEHSTLRRMTHSLKCTDKQSGRLNL